MNLKEALNIFNQQKILVIGDIMLDKFSWGDIKRLNPEQPAAPNVNVEENDETYALGGAANVANNIVSMGANCKLYGMVGRDFYGKKIQRICGEKKILLALFYHENPTNVKQRVMAHGQQVARLNYGEKNRGKIDLINQARLIERLKIDMENYCFIVLSDYDKGFFNEEFAQEIIRLANSRNIPTLVDAKPRNIDSFKGCTIIRPNIREAEKMTGVKYSKGNGTLKKMSEILSKRVGSKYVIITCGEDGAFIYDREKEMVKHIQTKARQVVDVTGAGDTFIATQALGFASGLDLFESTELANYASGIVVDKVGTATLTRKELLDRIKEDKKI